MADDQTITWTQMRSLLRVGDSEKDIESLLDSMRPADLLHAVFHLTADEQRKLLSIVSAERAAELIEEMPGSHAADLIEDMPATQVAPIVEEMASDLRVDVLAEMDKQDSDAILDQLEEEDALEIRELSAYPSDAAGGLMMTEFMAYPMNSTVREVLEDLTLKEGNYEFLTVHYIYVVVQKHKLKGVIRIRDLVFGDPEVKIATIVTPALTVTAKTELPLGAAVPRDVFRVLRKEMMVGIINGLALGVLLGVAAWLWKGNVVLGLVVGAALSINTVLAVSIGGTVPLVLKHFKMDPAVASGPLLTTITDMCGFLLVLGMASLVLPQLT